MEMFVPPKLTVVERREPGLGMTLTTASLNTTQSAADVRLKGDAQVPSENAREPPSDRTHRFRSPTLTMQPATFVSTSVRIRGRSEYAVLPGHSVVLLALGEMPAS